MDWGFVKSGFEWGWAVDEALVWGCEHAGQRLATKIGSAPDCWSARAASDRGLGSVADAWV